MLATLMVNASSKIPSLTQIKMLERAMHHECRMAALTSSSSFASGVAAACGRMGPE
ncbi:MAG: hypothetical protein VKO44_00890 [Cyanobacteriota bacterium]|nr:hypothetical protein [Cyanobacteriota bacterium]